MAYIQVEFKAIETSSLLARSMGVHRQQAIGSLVELWHYAWVSKKTVISSATLATLFEQNAFKCIESLIEFGFLEADEKDTYRIKGSDRYLRLREIKKAAGIKGAEVKKSRKQADVSTVEADVSTVEADVSTVEADVSTVEAPSKHLLSTHEAGAKHVLENDASSQPDAKQVLGNTEHRSQNTEHRQKTLVANATDEEIKKPKKTKKPTDPEYSARRKSLLTALTASYEQKRGSKYLHQGVKDEDALKRLIGSYDDRLILERWALGLVSDGWFRVSTISQLHFKFNDLANAPPVNQQLTTPKPKPKSTAEMLENSLKNAPTFRPLKERNPELWAQNEKWKAHQEEVEKQREEKRQEYEKLHLEKLRHYEQEKLADGDLSWEDALAQGEK